MLLAGRLPLQAQQSYSIDECVGMTCRHYPQAQEYGLIDQTLKYDISNAGLGWIPQLSISAKTTWQSEVVEMPFEIPGFDFNIPHDQYGVTADITQPLWDGGMSSNKKALAQAGAEVLYGKVPGQQIDYFELFSLKRTYSCSPASFVRTV